MKKQFSIKPVQSFVNEKNQLPSAKQEIYSILDLAGAAGGGKDQGCCPWLITFLGANVQQTPVLS
ncbi:hypothetical protein GCM10023187_47870 [Nibrella viscosa]|uniref:Uncharacterized protein n=1 Tax=Nibrella viscosa TaxID=1084524 RepID=A0ABP8KVN5_9BACT